MNGLFLATTEIAELEVLLDKILFSAYSAVMRKNPPHSPFLKGGGNQFPSLKRGVRGDF
jgi:hypothetical protein